MPRRTVKRLALALLAAAVCSAGALEAAATTPRARKAGLSAKTANATAGKPKKSKRRAKRERGQKAPTAERIAEIQKALAQDGSYSGTPTGKWDARSVEAMKQFQAAHGLNPTGKLDAHSLQKLGMGSDVAGVAAPLPGISTTSTALPDSTHPQP